MRSAAITARKLTASIAKQMPVPTATMSRPAIAGPTMRADCAIALLSPTALGSSAGVTISDKNDCRVGLSITWANPPANAST